jgi:two-component system, NtrC family, sensor kinase
MKKLNLLFLFFLIIFTQKAFSNDTIVFNNESTIQSIGNRIYLLKDESSKLSFEDVLKSDKFVKSNENVPNLGISKNTFWIRFSVKNEFANRRILLQLQYPIIDKVEFYAPTISGRFDTIKAGELFPFDHREINNQNYLFYLDVPQSETYTYYMRVESGEQIQLPLLMGAQQPIYEDLIQKDLVFGLYIGIILVMAIYNLFVYFTVRDKSYLYYVSYIIFVGLTQAVLQGYGFKYLWPNSTWLVLQSTFLVPVLNGWAAIAFVKHFLNTKETYPLGNKILNWIFVFYAICFVLSIMNKFYYAQNLVQLTASIGSLLTIYIAYKIGKQGYRPANYFLVAWTIFLLSVVVFVFRNFNILPYNNLTFYALQIGSALEVTLLSFALADKINIYRKEKEESQLEALRILQENEKIIREQNVMLEVKVEERTHELNVSNQELNTALTDLKNAQTQLVDAEKMASLGQLTAGIAHEINNPINFVSSNIKPLRRDIEDIQELIKKYEDIIKEQNIDDKFTEVQKFKKELDYDYLTHEIDVLLKGMADGAGRTVEIVKGLKSFSRLDESDLKYANINEGIDSTLIILSSTFRGKINIIKELGQIPEIECFAGKLNQVFMNIINNAAQAVLTAHGNDDEGKVVIRTQNNGDNVSIHIIDNGIGMTEEVRSKIFDPFFTTKKAGEGTGLGLSIVYSIIELHKGNIEVKSEPGVGTEFIITLPLNQ